MSELQGLATPVGRNFVPDRLSAPLNDGRDQLVSFDIGWTAL